jgi:hypothetical protein
LRNLKLTGRERLSPPARCFGRTKVSKTKKMNNQIVNSNLADKRFYIYELPTFLSYKTKVIIHSLAILVKSYYSSESYQALRHKLNNSKEYYLFRRYCLTRDNYKCVKCNHHATQVHHLVEVKDDPCLALDPTNGISLCNDCHTLQHSWLTNDLHDSVE